MGSINLLEAALHTFGRSFEDYLSEKILVAVSGAASQIFLSTFPFSNVPPYQHYYIYTLLLSIQQLLGQSYLFSYCFTSIDFIVQRPQHIGTISNTAFLARVNMPYEVFKNELQGHLVHAQPLSFIHLKRGPV